MRMTVRRYRRRRTGSDSLGFAQSRFSAPFFDRLVYLSQSINQTRKPDVPWMILVSRDKFFCAGLQHCPPRLHHCCDYDTLEAALEAIQLWPSAKVVIDVESRSAPLPEFLDPLRKLTLYSPFTPVTLLLHADNYDGRLFCKAAGPFHVAERQLPAASLQELLNKVTVRDASRSDCFSRHEWALVQHLSCGNSLKAAAQASGLPYRRVIYRLGRILNKLGLTHRQELFHLLSRLSAPP